MQTNYRFLSLNLTVFLILITSTTSVNAYNPPTDITWSYKSSSGIHSKTILADGVIYYITDNGNAYALNDTSGSLIWNKKLPSKCSAPAISNEYVIFGCENKVVYGLDRQSGNRSWSEFIATPVKSNPTIKDNTVFIGDDRGFIYALNAENGKTLWKKKIGDNIKHPLYVVDEILYAISGNKLSSIDISDGKVNWYFTGDSDLTTSPNSYSKYLSIPSINKKVYFLDKDTGNRIWDYEAGSEVKGSPVMTRKGLYFTDKSGSFYHLDTHGNMLWKKTLEGNFETDTILFRGKIFAASKENKLFVINPEDGTIEYMYNLTSEIKHPPIFSMGRMIISQTDSMIIAYGGSVDIALDDIQIEKQYALDNQIVPIRVFIKNNGLLVIDRANISLSIDRTPLYSEITSLQPNSITEIVFNITADTGRHLVEAQAVLPQGVKDIDLENNHFVSALWIRSHWPMHRHDVQRTGDVKVLDSFEED